MGAEAVMSQERTLDQLLAAVQDAIHATEKEAAAEGARTVDAMHLTVRVDNLAIVMALLAYIAPHWDAVIHLIQTKEGKHES
jgi:hypothetical protein